MYLRAFRTLRPLQHWRHMSTPMEDLVGLIEAGFPKVRAQAALQQANGDVEEAFHLLMAGDANVSNERDRRSKPATPMEQEPQKAESPHVPPTTLLADFIEVVATHTGTTAQDWTEEATALKKGKYLTAALLATYDWEQNPLQLSPAFIGLAQTLLVVPAPTTIPSAAFDRLLCHPALHLDPTGTALRCGVEEGEPELCRMCYLPPHITTATFRVDRLGIGCVVVGPSTALEGVPNPLDLETDRPASLGSHVVSFSFWRTGDLFVHKPQGGDQHRLGLTKGDLLSVQCERRGTGSRVRLIAKGQSYGPYLINTPRPRIGIGLETKGAAISLVTSPPP
eukprot:NODE_2207_length_1250_cov_13.653606_g2096_i0.p1 GENE.NODE_2207_length_1250_cov_13.653606_g2096_i0~~NODE_2207_length_1250_cov_13.653606_g2096_i0.p1  ORF type:complete len:350 (+),score=94.90 NODE_2207_length_1250_cov_13.653606_g2096_i0:41-1051(+)